MRVIIPDEIKRLIDIQRPFLVFDGKGFVLKEDAPAEVVKAREITQKWSSEHGRDYPIRGSNN